MRARHALPPSVGLGVQIQCTKLCRSKLPANYKLRSYYAPRPFLLFRRVLILRHCDAFVTNFTAAKFRALYCTKICVRHLSTESVEMQNFQQVAAAERETEKGAVKALTALKGRPRPDLLPSPRTSRRRSSGIMR
ncbi:hypothetical protein EVAR_88533_1 [Eumeta japonica]|uniref:Uncharacterized protein n=1 Tax=Eumeta variegata TaxID=151549 RepID=A0A4C1WK70_EUMVA|nr:hypothetical protein EVAR_88533_1 [Eumeta japonica]